MGRKAKSMGIFQNRKAISGLILVLIGVVIVAVVVGAVMVYSFLPGNVEVQEYDFEGFTEVDVGGAFQVTITQGDRYSVTVTADEKIFSDVKVAQDGNVLSIGMEPSFHFGMHTREAEITMPALQKFTLSGASQGRATGFSSTDTFILDVSGASSLQLNDVETVDLEVDLSGASNLNMQGSGSNLEIQVSGASNADLTSFLVNNAVVDVSGASQMTVNVIGRLDVEVSGASSVHYIGEPTLGTVNISGASTINRR